VRKKTFVVPNMVRDFGTQTADVATGADNLIAAVGRLADAKDHETLIRAWARIAHQYPLWRVAIYGQGPLLSHLRGVRRELEVERLTFEAPTTEIESVYAQSKFLAMPSIHEGFGLVTAEAMACGLPVVGFADCEGTNEIILPGENGILVEPGDDRGQAFAHGLSQMIEDEEMRIALAASAPATAKRYDADHALDLWEAVINGPGTKAGAPGA
jgi:glycosyltransferase involved in cell wall biosynthesis